MLLFLYFMSRISLRLRKLGSAAAKVLRMIILRRLIRRIFLMFRDDNVFFMVHGCAYMYAY